MTKQEALEFIDKHKNALENPMEMLNWTWLRIIILQIPEDRWNKFVEEAQETLRG